MISDKRCRFIFRHAKGMALDAVWLYLEDDSDSYEDRKENFLWVLKRMVSEGAIKFAKNGISIAGGDAVEMLKDAFPEDDESVNNGVWFFTDLCPAGIGWIMPDGSIDWV